VPSLGEGFGMVALEAMERARPVIASAVGGLVDIVRDGQTGTLVPPGEVEPLARAIVELVTDSARAVQMGAAGREHVLDRFGDERSLERMELLYRSLLEASRWPLASEADGGDHS
jgi:glycosyltransferase involved in cell wall biosynthesis